MLVWLKVLLQCQFYLNICHDTPSMTWLLHCHCNVDVHRHSVLFRMTATNQFINIISLS